MYIIDVYHIYIIYIHVHVYIFSSRSDLIPKTEKKLEFFFRTTHPPLHL